MDSIIQTFLERIKVGAKQSHRNMTVYCLLAAQDCGVDFLTLQDALNLRVLTIKDLGEAADVPRLRVVNKCHQNVLILNGEEIEGTKQNRVLNLTTLIAPNSEVVIPELCAEQGRESHTSREVRDESPAKGSHMKQHDTESVPVGIGLGDGYSPSRRLVSNEVRTKYARITAPAPYTLTMVHIHQSRKLAVDEYLTPFHTVDNQLGMIVFLDGYLAGVEILARFWAFRQVHRRLMQSYVIHALNTATGKTDAKKPSRTVAQRILDRAATGSIRRLHSASLGLHIRLESDDVIGFGFEHENQVLQMSLFPKSENPNWFRPTSIKRVTDRSQAVRFGFGEQ